MPEGSKTATRNLCPYCSNALGFEELKAHVISVHKIEPLPKPEGWIRMKVNRQAHELKVEPEWTLYRLSTTNRG